MQHILHRQNIAGSVDRWIADSPRLEHLQCPAVQQRRLHLAGSCRFTQSVAQSQIKSLLLKTLRR